RLLVGLGLLWAAAGMGAEGRTDSIQSEPAQGNSGIVREVVSIKYVQAKRVKHVLTGISAPHAVWRNGEQLTEFAKQKDDAVAKLVWKPLNSDNVVVAYRENALLISGTPEELRQCKAVIAELDCVEPQ